MSLNAIAMDSTIRLIDGVLERGINIKEVSTLTHKSFITSNDDGYIATLKI